MPHYVSLAPSPRAALALCRRFGELLGTDVDLEELEQASEEYSQQVTEAVSSDAETSAYVEELERRVDMMEAEEELPSGDSLAAELTRFLREREENGDDSGMVRRRSPPASTSASRGHQVRIVGLTGGRSPAPASMRRAARRQDAFAGSSSSSSSASGDGTAWTAGFPSTTRTSC